MKRTTIYTTAALALLLGLAACTQDDAGSLPEGVEGTPIIFTATGLNPTATATTGTRAPVDGNWLGVSNVSIAINGSLRIYDVNPAADNTSATLTSKFPYYWTNLDDITVSAWWPHNTINTIMPDVVVKRDQSTRADYEASDFISAENQTVSYGNAKLHFTHRTALVHIVLTDYDEELESVRLTNLSTEYGNPAEITPYDEGNYVYSALVAPQSVAAGTVFITGKFNENRRFLYKMQNATEWKADGEYTYTVSLAEAKEPDYTLSGDGRTYKVRNANGLLAWANAAQNDLSLNCTLTDDIDLTGKEWTPVGKNDDNPYTGTFDGGGHAITGLTSSQRRSYMGVIGHLGSGGTVQNLTLKSVNLYGFGYTGGVTGLNEGTITGCTISGDIAGNDYIGGVAGYNEGTVIACYHASGSISGNSDVGGVVGWNNGGTVTACYHASGSVSGNTNVGGVVGRKNGGTVATCYWNDSPDTGIGSGNGEATKVDDTTVTWLDAVDAMNIALQNASSVWRYKFSGELPTLEQQ